MKRKKKFDPIKKLWRRKPIDGNLHVQFSLDKGVTWMTDAVKQKELDRANKSG